MEDISKTEEGRAHPIGETGSVTPEERYFSNSGVTCFQECPRKYYWSYVALLTPKKKSSPLGFGTAVHSGIKNLYRNQAEKNQELVAQYIPNQGEELRTQAKLENIFRTYQAEKFPMLWEVVAVEDPIKFTVGGHTFVVIPDLVVKWRDEFFVIEHKHTTRLTANFFEKFQRDSQIDAEMLAVRSKYGSCGGVYVNGIVIRKGGPKSKLAEVELIMDKITRTEDQLRESERYFYNWIERTLQEITFPENRRSCFNYNSRCGYLPLCTETAKPDSDLYEKRERSLSLIFKTEEEEE